MRHLLTGRAGLWAPPVLYMAVMFGLSSESHPIPVVTVHIWDKLLHLSEYGLLALLFARALVGEGLGWLAAMVAAMLMTSAYGVTDEWHQSFVPLRSADVHDWFADTLGAVIGASIYRVGAIVGLTGVPRARHR
jgi:VanZ family protein